MKPRICCILPPGPEADVLILESAQRQNLWQNYFSFQFATPEKFPHGFDLYVCPWFMVSDLVRETTGSRAPVIAFGPNKMLAHSFETGAQDYMKDPWDIEELHVRARKLIETHGYALSWGLVVCDGFESRVDGVDLLMPPGAHRMFRLLVSNAGIILSSALLFKLLQVENLQSRTLSVYVSEIRQKLALVCAENPMDILRTHYRKGYSVKA